IILAVANLGSNSSFGRLGIKTLAYYLCTSMLAILVGLTLVDIVMPGVDSAGRGILVGEDLSAFADAQAEVEGKAGGSETSDVLNVFRQMVPDNIFSFASDNARLL